MQMKLDMYRRSLIIYSMQMKLDMYRRSLIIYRRCLGNAKSHKNGWK